MRIEVFHDTVCPWCRIKKRQLDLALSAWDGPAVTIRWRPFLLDPSVPAEGRDFGAYMAERKGARNLAPMFEAVPPTGASVGLRFALKKVRFATNTVRSHAPVAAAPDWTRNDPLDALHRAYFEVGRDIGHPDTLIDIAVSAGLDASSAGRAIHGEEIRAAILAEAEATRRLGISGVPLVVVNRSRIVSGARPPFVILEAMHAALTDEPAGSRARGQSPVDLLPTLWSR